MRLGGLLLVSVLFLSFSVSAGEPIETRIQVVPPHPRAGEPVSLRLSGSWSDGCVPERAQVARIGNGIFVDLITRVEMDPHAICTMAITPWDLTIPVGALEAGMYFVTVVYKGKPVASASFSVSGPVVMPVPIPNGDFERGAVGGIPTQWTLGEAFLQQNQEQDAHPAEEHDLRLVSEAHFRGSQALYGMAKAIPPRETSPRSTLPFGEQFVYVWIASDWISAPGADMLGLRMREVKVERNADWGYGAYILVVFEDGKGLHPNPFGRWDVVWNSPQLLFGRKEAMGIKDNAVGEERGNDGAVWKLYRVPIPEEVDRKRFNVKIFWIAHNWNSQGPGYWVSISSYIDSLELITGLSR